MVDTPNPAVLAADVVLLSRQSGQWHVLVVLRGHPPFEGCWALPGGRVDPGETFERAARRELAEETGLLAPARLIEVGVYDAPARDPRGRVISVAFVGVLTGQPNPMAGDDAAAARWVPVAELLADPSSLAFDHARILRDALCRVRGLLVGCRASSAPDGAACGDAETVHGFHDGDRVRDTRDGSLGTVRFLDLDPAERESGEYAVAEICWDGSFVACELDLALPRLERVDTSSQPQFTRPDAHPAKNVRRVGAPNTQQSGETPMVGNNGTAHDVVVDEIQELLYSGVERFGEADHGAVLVRFAPLADLVAELVTRARVERAALWELLKRSGRNGIELAGHNTDVYREWCDVHTDLARLRAGLCAVLGHDTDPAAYPGDEPALADLRELAAENRLREQDILDVIGERDTAEAELARLDTTPTVGNHGEGGVA